MNVKLISKTQPVEGLEGVTDAESLIVYLARVSSKSRTGDNPDKLLTYCMKHGHWSVFTMADMTVEVQTTKAVGIQILRHWSFDFQEFSQRYSTVSDQPEPIEIRMMHEGGNRQGSGDPSDSLSHKANVAAAKAKVIYDELIDEGAAAESARMVLPMATPTTIVMKGNVRSWITYFWQRLDAHAQKEHRLLAEEIFKVFEQEFPICSNLAKSYKPQIVYKPYEIVLNK